METRRAVNLGLVVGGAAATTSLMLWLFQDSAEQVAINQNQNQNQKQQVVESAVLKKKRGSKRELEKPLTSRGFARIGDGTILLQDYVAGLLTLAEKAAKKRHGAGFINNFGQLIVLVTKPEHVRKILASQVAHELGGMKPASAAFFGDKVLFILEGKEWRDLRNLLRTPFMKHNLPMMSLDVTNTAFELSNALENCVTKKNVIDMHFVLSMYHLSAIGKAAFNFDLDCLHQMMNGPNEIVEAFEYLLLELPRRAYSPDASVREDYETPNDDNRKWKKHAHAVRGVVDKVVKARLEERTKGQAPRNDLLDNMIASYESEFGQTMDSNKLMDALGDNLVEILFAGYNTSVQVMSIALYYVARNPEWAAKIEKEVDQALGGLAVGESIDMSKLPICKAVFHESLRLIPPAPLVYRSLTSDTELEPDLIIPSGTAVWLPAIYLHKDPNSWGPDAAVFNPQRWLDQTERPYPQGAYIPFSHGPRECLGSHFAMLESVTALAVLFKNFKFKIPPEYSFKPTFTGFGLRPYDQTTQKVAMNLELTQRVSNSEFMYNWSPARVTDSKKLQQRKVIVEETKT